MSVMHGVLFVPIVFAASAWVGQTGVIWSMALTKTLMFGAATGIFAVRRRTILAPTAAESAVAETALEPVAG